MTGTTPTPSADAAADPRNTDADNTGLHAARAAILALAAQRDAALPTLGVRTVAAPRDIQAALEALALPARLPEDGIGASAAVGRVMRDVGRGLAGGQAGPRYFGFITGGTLPSSQLADFLTTIYDQNVGSNRPDESIAAVVESRALEFILDLLHLPRHTYPARVLTSGATESNVLGLALARDHAVRHALSATPATHGYSAAEHGLGGVALKVYSDRPHASLIKAAATVGIGRANVVDMARVRRRDDGEEEVGIDVEELEACLREATPGSGRGAIVSLSFGEVNTGDFTPDVCAIRALCDRYGVWLHIDAAFGGYARLVRDLVGPMADDLECADSITLDGHKWLNVPYDCGIFFSRSVAHQASVFGPSPAHGVPAYLARATAGETSTMTGEMRAAQGVPDPMTQTIANSRRFRALPVYAALLDQGRAGYVALVRRNVLFARRVAAWMGSGAGRGYYEVMNLRGGTTPLNMVLFRAGRTNPVAAYREERGRLERAINGTGEMQVTGGAGGCVRMGVSNWQTGEDDFGIVVRVLLSIVEEHLI